MTMLSRFATLGGQAGPPDPYFANVSFLLVGNGANGTNTNIRDSSSNNIAVTNVGSTTISTAVSPPSVTGAGSGTVYFNGSSQLLALASSSGFAIGTGNFTVELWYRPVSNPTQYPPIWGNDPAGGYTADVITFCDRHIIAPGKFAFFSFNYGGPMLVGTTTVTNGQWYHLAIVRNGNVYTLYVNGAAESSVTTGVVLTSTTTMPLSIGGQTSGQYTNSYIYDFRFTKGIARYTANYTPPPFPPTAAMPTY
jgi:hypothetical protein